MAINVIMATNVMMEPTDGKLTEEQAGSGSGVVGYNCSAAIRQAPTTCLRLYAILKVIIYIVTSNMATIVTLWQLRLLW